MVGTPRVIVLAGPGVCYAHVCWSGAMRVKKHAVRGNEPRTLAWGLLALVLFALCYIHQSRYTFATAFSRLALLETVVSHGRLEIDRYRAKTSDTALVNGHHYSDKAPGTAALALPAFAAAARVLEAQDRSVDSEIGWLVASWVTCAFSQALPAALGAVALFMSLSRVVRFRPALLSVLALTLGCLALPYSTLLFSHAQVIGLIGMTIWAIGLWGETAEDVRARRAEARRGRGENGSPKAEDEGQRARQEGEGTVAKIGRWRMALAGFCLGLALASEYTAGLVVVALAVYVVWKRRAGLWAFVLAAVAPLLLIPAYSWAVIGNPFELPYSYQANFEEMREGLYAIKWPDLENLGRLVFGPTRGLVFWTPFLIMAGFGWWSLARERPGHLWLTYALPVVHALVISGRTWDWQAGFTISARYMAPILPLLALPCAIGTQRWPKMGGVLAILSITMMTVATITDACPDYSMYNPLTELHMPKVIRGEFSHTLGTDVFGLHPWVSVGLYYAVLICGVKWLWRLAGRADKESSTEPLTRADCR
ncbi:MAG: hypothetical protein BWX48_00079 [Verrucomicrobia bacterium ADurb.Bin006]|nr:MAG: hypothetical protein BWX48_00079 [Verrucomicrobia bacterium ADurb.Bin006]